MSQLLAGKANFSQPSEVISIALVRQVHGRVAFQAMQKRIVPNGLIQDRMLHPLCRRASARTEAGAGFQCVQDLFGGCFRSEKRGMHRTTHILAVRTRYDRAIHRNDATHGNRRRRASCRTRIRHDRPRQHHRHSQQLVHLPPYGPDVLCIKGTCRGNCFCERRSDFPQPKPEIGRWEITTQ